MGLLPRWVGARQQRSGLAEPEVELPEQALALTYPQLDSVGLLNPGRQRLAVPQIDPHSRVARFRAEHPIHFLDLLFAQTAGAARSLPLG
jgi:hypothetical protein